MAIELSIKNGGPYSKKDQKARRDEVFKLHLENGYSARKISDILKVNRNTINSDIKLCYSQLRKQEDYLWVEDVVNKNIYRLENQRSRFLERLEKTSDFKEILLIEKMIFEIELKLIQINFKQMTSKQSQYDAMVRALNQICESEGETKRYFLWADAIKVSVETKEKINKLLNADKNSMFNLSKLL